MAALQLGQYRRGHEIVGLLAAAHLFGLVAQAGLGDQVVGVDQVGAPPERDAAPASTAALSRSRVLTCSSAA